MLVRITATLYLCPEYVTGVTINPGYDSWSVVIILTGEAPLFHEVPTRDEAMRILELIVEKSQAAQSEEFEDFLE